MKIPEQYLPVMPYLIVNNAKAFADFARKVFGATEQLLVPVNEHTIRHGELKIHDAVIMFADATEEWAVKPAAMYLYVADVDRVYGNALLEGAKSLQVPGDKGYGYTAGFEDAFGNQWFVVAG